MSAFETRWFCAHLQVAGESLLVGEHSYRFTYVPSFDPPRVVVVARERGEWVVVGKVLSGKGGYAAGKLVRTTKRTLAPEEIRLLEQRLENAGVWEPTDGDTRAGADGSEWLLEATQGRRYIFHQVWSPSESTFPQYRRACVYMLQLANIQPGPDDRPLY